MKLGFKSSLTEKRLPDMNLRPILTGVGLSLAVLPSSNLGEWACQEWLQTGRVTASVRLN
jgi:hypothetical protein